MTTSCRVLAYCVATAVGLAGNVLAAPADPLQASPALRVLATSPTAATGSSSQVVDFRYGPPWWQTAICLPDDPEKTLVGKEGQFLFDFGGRGPRNFTFSVAPQLAGDVKWLRQETVSARAPVVRTWWEAGDVVLLTEAFLAIPDSVSVPSARASASIRLVSQESVRPMTNWAHPAALCEEGFRHGLVGDRGTPLTFDISVPAGSAAQVVFGLCEGHWDRPGQRPLKLTVEGGASREVDAVKDHGHNVPGLYVLEGRDANGDGRLRALVESLPNAPDRNTVLNVLWVFTGSLPPQGEIISGKANPRALACKRFGDEPLGPRHYAALLTLKNTGAKPQTRRPVLRIESTVPVDVEKKSGVIAIGSKTQVQTSLPVAGFDQQDKTWTVRLEPVDIPAGQSRAVAVAVLRHAAAPDAAPRVEDLLRRRDRVVEWWEHADLPWNTIQVPDPGIQGMLESCIRNIWQAREIKSGQPAFHVGPTVYRGLWIVDGAFLLESAALVGRALDARAGIHYILGFQKPGGEIAIKHRFWKENGIVLWTCCRHAVLTQDKAWLESVWPKLEKIVAAIQRLRERSRAEPPELDDGLMPTGDTDGGIGGDYPEYSNVYWNLAGLKAVIDTAEWLGKKEQAGQWRKEYDDFLATFRKAAQRDLQTDPHGNRYLPTVMGEGARKYSPQRGQWAFMHAVYPGQLFAKDDALVEGNLAMLRATRQQGLIFGTGWQAQGIWAYASSFYGHAVLWQGGGEEAARVLYDYANHAAPVRAWVEEQMPVGKGGGISGDMPHNWASAEFIRLTTHLIQLDRGDELHLLEGFPRQWLGAGMVTRLNGVPTPFGPLQLSVKVADDGRTATVEFQPLAANCRAIVVHQPDGTACRLPPDRAGKATFPVGGQGE